MTTGLPVRRVSMFLGLALITGAGCGTTPTDGDEIGGSGPLDGDAVIVGDGNGDTNSGGVPNETDSGERPDSGGRGDESGSDVAPGPDSGSSPDTDPDAFGTRPLRCVDLDCDAEGRDCAEGDDITDARCGQCLSGFIQDGEGCAPPTAASLGGPCTTDAQCPIGSWCSTVEGFRRCSPRLFAGEPHQMAFVYVPAGTFEQGTPGATNDERTYTATLTRNYFVSRTEVTQGQWKAATSGTNPSCFQTTSGTSCSTTNAFNAGPVEKLDWYSALAYANWLSSQNGLQQCYTLSGCSDSSTGWFDGVHSACTGATFTGPGCTGYRLLTESEWERAARGGATTFSTYYWGEATDATTVGQHAWFTSNSGRRTQGVGQKVMNAYGLYDMSGNVWEFVWDWDAFSYPSGSATDYTGPSSGSFRGSRGGSWSHGAFHLRSARRFDFGPTSRAGSVGLRLARTLP